MKRAEFAVWIGTVGGFTVGFGVASTPFALPLVIIILGGLMGYSAVNYIREVAESSGDPA